MTQMKPVIKQVVLQENAWFVHLKDGPGLLKNQPQKFFSKDGEILWLKESGTFHPDSDVGLVWKAAIVWMEKNDPSILPESEKPATPEKSPADAYELMAWASHHGENMFVTAALFGMDLSHWSPSAPVVKPNYGDKWPSIAVKAHQVCESISGIACDLCQLNVAESVGADTEDEEEEMEEAFASELESFAAYHLMSAYNAAVQLGFPDGAGFPIEGSIPHVEEKCWPSLVVKAVEEPCCPNIVKWGDCDGCHEQYTALPQQTETEVISKPATEKWKSMLEKINKSKLPTLEEGPGGLLPEQVTKTMLSSTPGDIVLTDGQVADLKYAAEKDAEATKALYKKYDKHARNQVRAFAAAHKITMSKAYATLKLQEIYGTNPYNFFGNVPKKGAEYGWEDFKDRANKYCACEKYCVSVPFMKSFFAQMTAGNQYKITGATAAPSTGGGGGSSSGGVYYTTTTAPSSLKVPPSLPLMEVDLHAGPEKVSLPVDVVQVSQLSTGGQKVSIKLTVGSIEALIAHLTGVIDEKSQTLKPGQQAVVTAKTETSIKMFEDDVIVQVLG